MPDGRAVPPGVPVSLCESRHEIERSEVDLHQAETEVGQDRRLVVVGKIGERLCGEERPQDRVQRKPGSCRSDAQIEGHENEDRFHLPADDGGSVGNRERGKSGEGR